MMEISKGLRKEIMLVQNKLKNAIRDHQICMGKLKDNPNNAETIGQIEEIRLHIISLGRCQKQIVQRLRKEVESFKVENVNGAKLSVASLLGLNNNNNNSNHNNNNHNNNNSNNNANNNKSKNNKHVAVDENKDKEDVVQVKVKPNRVFDNRRLSKENYEEVVRNGIDASSRKENICAKERSRSVEFLPTEEDIIEVSDDENTCENHDDVERLEGIEEAPSSEQCKLNSKQVIFLGNLALITASKFSELQNKRAERKRRSTANPQFVYSNWDIPTKRKRHSYLQSVGNAPQTRQTTARLNGPSPPPSKISPSKTTSPSTKSSSSKSLMLIQKSTTVRPNILRNISESEDLSNKTQHENGISDMPISDSKSLQPKTMHIPGLPSCLTIERIESDTAVCIYCRNPGTLIYCDDCPSSYHASCRSSSPPPVRLCSKCVQNQKDDDRTQTPVIKKDEEIEEKERERYEQRERNSDLRLQVYELEKRSQLLGQSFQLQHHLRQELLTKQEKTQKSIKRLVDFIKLMQLRPANSSPPPTMTSISSQSPPTSSPFHLVTSPIQRSFTQQISSPTSPTTPTSPTQLTLNTSVTRALTISPIHHSSSISSTINSPTNAVNCQSPTFKQRNSHSNHFLSSKKCPTHQLAESLVINTTIPINIPNTIIHTVNSRTQQLITDYQSLNHEKDKMILSVPRHSSTISSPVIAPSQQFETIKSPLPARYPDSSPSHARKNPSPMATMTAATSVSWNHHHHHHQQQLQTSETMGANPKSLVPLDTNQLNSQTVSAVNLKNQQPINWSQMPITTNQTIVQNPGIYSTHCSQAITSPITSPIVMINGREKSSIISHQDQSQIDCIDDSLKINRVCVKQESPPPNSTNT